VFLKSAVNRASAIMSSRIKSQLNVMERYASLAKVEAKRLKSLVSQISNFASVTVQYWPTAAPRGGGLDAVLARVQCMRLKKKYRN
jgi:plasmid replication initiation protein